MAGFWRKCAVLLLLSVGIVAFAACSPAELVRQAATVRAVQSWANDHPDVHGVEVRQDMDSPFPLNTMTASAQYEGMDARDFFRIVGLLNTQEADVLGRGFDHFALDLTSRGSDGAKQFTWRGPSEPEAITARMANIAEGDVVTAVAMDRVNGFHVTFAYRAPREAVMPYVEAVAGDLDAVSAGISGNVLLDAVPLRATPTVPTQIRLLDGAGAHAVRRLDEASALFAEGAPSYYIRRAEVKGGELVKVELEPLIDDTDQLDRDLERWRQQLTDDAFAAPDLKISVPKWKPSALNAGVSDRGYGTPRTDDDLGALFDRKNSRPDAELREQAARNMYLAGALRKGEEVLRFRRLDSGPGFAGHPLVVGDLGEVGSERFFAVLEGLSQLDTAADNGRDAAGKPPLSVDITAMVGTTRVRWAGPLPAQGDDPEALAGTSERLARLIAAPATEVIVSDRLTVVLDPDAGREEMERYVTDIAVPVFDELRQHGFKPDYFPVARAGEPDRGFYLNVGAKADPDRPGATGPSAATALRLSFQEDLTSHGMMLPGEAVRVLGDVDKRVPSYDITGAAFVGDKLAWLNLRPRGETIVEEELVALAQWVASENAPPECVGVPLTIEDGLVPATAGVGGIARDFTARPNSLQLRALVEDEQPGCTYSNPKPL